MRRWLVAFRTDVGAAHGACVARPVCSPVPRSWDLATGVHRVSARTRRLSEVETAEDGLGPPFNATSCAVCHSLRAVGGSGILLETPVAYRNPDGTFQGLNRAVTR